MVQHMILSTGPETLRITEVKGHPTDEDVEQGRVRAEDKFGKADADTAAKLVCGRGYSWSLYLGYQVQPRRSGWYCSLSCGLGSLGDCQTL